MFRFVAQKECSGWIFVPAHITDIIPVKETHISDGSTITPADFR